MVYHTFEALFRRATGHAPYPYQCRLADQDRWPSVITVPTGAGKTAAVLLAWLWRRRFHPDPRVREGTPRRLVYCLPMRVLVEQCAKAVQTYLTNAGLLADGRANGIQIHVLMGGEPEEDWYLYPEREAVLMGTQDMLLSRTLNRGYVLSRFRWPVAFGLLNNDVLWVLDEVQLMGAGLPTSAQLAAFRQRFGAFGPCRTVWMSATLRPEWLQTVDHRAPGAEDILELDADDTSHEVLRVRLYAPKGLRQLAVGKTPGAAAYPRDIARHAAFLHKPGTRTLVVLNTVGRARDVYRTLVEPAVWREQRKDRPDVVLLHSRFRPPDRLANLERVLAPLDARGPGQVVVSTQVLEAGVDMTCAVLVTELAPWPSMVQRFGRCNRYGERADAQVWWVDVPDRFAAPYEAEDLRAARELLRGLEGASAAPAHLPDPAPLQSDHDVLRRRDLLDLFDTAPDLAGNDVDVSRFVRDVRETDLRVCWRSWPAGPPPEGWPRPVRNELCPAPVGELRDWLRGRGREAWVWDHLDRAWRRARPDELWPGQVLVLRSESGGYNPLTGWDPSSESPVAPLGADWGPQEESGGDDPETFAVGFWQSLADHSRAVAEEMESLLTSLRGLGLEGFAEDLRQAALWHDLGKAHPVFQETLLRGLDGDERELRAAVVWAKATGPVRRHARPHFRHELVSALALLAARLRGDAVAAGVSDLALYLVAAHHGRVRLAIRSFPGSDGLRNALKSARMILGVQDGEELPAVVLGPGLFLPSVQLEMWPAELGGREGQESWLSRTLRLRDSPELGPFRLAYLEALLRAADARASAGDPEAGE